MISAWFDRYSKALEITTQRIELGALDIAVGDLLMILSGIMNDVRSNLHIADIDRRLTSLEDIDLEGLDQAISILRRSDNGERKFSVPGRRIVRADEQLAVVEKHIEKLRSERKSGSKKNRTFYVALVLGTDFNDLLLCYQPNDPSLPDLQKLIEAKIAMLPELEQGRVWADTQNDYRALQGAAPEACHLNEILKESFFDPADDTELVRRMAAYKVVVRPQLVREMIEKGADSIPISNIGLGLLLTISQGTNLVEVSPDEQVLAIELTRLVRCLLKLQQREEKVLAILGIDSKGIIAGGGLVERLDKSLEGLASRKEQLTFCVSAMSRILVVTSAYVSHRSRIESSLMAFKLGIELFADDHRTSIEEKKGELELQKDVCKYLLDRDIVSYGTKFGRSQIDLLVKYEVDTVVVEAKVLRDRVTQAKIDEYLAQLVSYMDQREPFPAARGVLLIFNISNTPIDAPRKWLRSRFWILVMNLCPEPPSGRREFAIIDETSDGSIVRVVVSKD